MIHRRNLRSNHGFTLVESLATLTIAGILLAAAVPYLGDLIASNQQTTAINTMVTCLHLARSEAITQRYRAVICASDNGTTCQKSTQWSNGYLLFIDKDADRMLDKDEQIVRFQQVDDSVRILTTNGRKTITYQTDGMSPGSNLTITFCDASQHVAPKAVIVSNTGRPRVSDTRPDGSPLSCT